MKANGRVGAGTKTHFEFNGENRATWRRSADAGAGETLTDTRVVVLFLGWGLHQLVVDA